MFIVVVHDEFDVNADGDSNNKYFGPFVNKDEAISHLRQLADDFDDDMFVVSPDGTWAGYDHYDLEMAGRDPKVCSELWLQVADLNGI